MERLSRMLMGQRSKLLARRLLQWALRAIGPVVLVVLLVRVVDYGELRALLGDIRILWLIGALATVQCIILLRTFRWIELHRAFGLQAAPFTYQLRLSYATSFATLVLPQIVNPLSRLVLLMQDGYRTGRALAGSALEKALEFAAYLGFGVYGSIVLASTFGGLAWWASGLAAVVLVVAGVLYLLRGRVGQALTAVLERMPGLGEVEGDRSQVAHDMVSIDRAVALRLGGWSLMIALTQATTLFLLTRSMGIDLSYPFMVAVWGIIAFSMLLPLTVNGVGTREAILVAAFSAADRSTDAAVAIGLLTLAVVAAGSSPGAVEWLWRFMSRGARSAASPEPAPVAAHSQGGRGH